MLHWFFAPQISQRQRQIDELHCAMVEAERAHERNVIQQRSEQEQHKQFLLQQITRSSVNGGTEASSLQRQLDDLQKELAYYKQSSRDLRKRLREYEPASQSTSGSTMGSLETRAPHTSLSSRTLDQHGGPSPLPASNTPAQPTPDVQQPTSHSSLSGRLKSADKKAPVEGAHQSQVR